MKKTIFILALFISGFLYSCEKDNDSIEIFPTTLYTNKITQVSNVRMFINKKEIFDREIIKSFTQDAECFNLPTNNIIEKKDTIIFHSRDSVSFSFVYDGHNVEKKGDLFLFHSKYFVCQEQNDRISPSSLLKYDTQNIPVDFNQYLKKALVVGYGSYNRLELCFTAYKLSLNDDWSGSWMWGTFLNEFNESAKNLLTAKDTLAIQEYRILFSAK